jgi:hypothetical protein
VDEDYARINSEVLAGQAEIVNTPRAGRGRPPRGAGQGGRGALLDAGQGDPARGAGRRGRLGFVQLLSAGVDAVDFTAVPERLMVSATRARTPRRCPST